MPDRALVQEIVEIGVETVVGTAVPSTVKLQAVQVELDSDITVDRIAPSGNLWDTIAAPRQEYSSARSRAIRRIRAAVGLLQRASARRSSRTPTGAVLARRYSWAPSSSFRGRRVRGRSGAARLATRPSLRRTA
jgi:hypothetical protein